MCEITKQGFSKKTHKQKDVQGAHWWPGGRGMGVQGGSERKQTMVGAECSRPLM